MLKCIDSFCCKIYNKDNRNGSAKGVEVTLKIYGIYLGISAVILIGFAIMAYASDGLDYKNTVIHKAAVLLRYAYLRLYVAVQYGLKYLRRGFSARCEEEISRYQSEVSRRMADIRNNEMNLVYLRNRKGVLEETGNKNRYKMKILK